MMNPLAGPAGPGKFSTRTDNLQMGSTSYGEGVETQAIQSGAPLSKTADVRGARASDVREAATQGPVTGLYEPTQRPDEPITSGIDPGDGVGSSALMMNQPDDYTNYDANIQSYMPVLSYISELVNTSPETRRAIRQLRDAL